MASSSSTPSSSITLPKKYHVFLSFRGEDNRAGFTAHLVTALRGKQIATFIDYEIERGDEISPALLKSIQESKIAVVIFSKDYASSTCCLRELAEIMKREKLRELIVLPVFYYVDPNDVCNQTGPFKDSFAKHENDSPEEVQEWRKAFTEASNLSGWDSAKTGDEAELVRKIVKDVQTKLMSEIENISPPSNDFEGRLIGLNVKEKNLFLDIACFFDHESEDYIAKLLDCKGPLRSLVNKSLITIEYGSIRMQGPLQEMGREIVRRESPKNPGKRSRLWKSDDVIQTLKNNTGTKAVEGIYLNMDKLKDRHLNLSCEVFDKMTNLRVLLFTCDLKSDDDLESNKVHLSDGPLNSLPDELIILEWPTYPLRALPSNFSPKKLVKLALSYSNIEQLWEGTEDAPKLKWLLLDRCPRLTRIPNLSSSSSLEEVDLRDCESLVEFPLTSASIKRLCLSGTAIEEVPSSIQHLTKLVKLDLSRCTRLKHISAGCFKLESVTTLEMLPSSICDLTSLEHLDLSNCTKLDKLPENLGNLKSLKGLTVKGSAVRQLPSSITCLENLESLDCSKCRGLTRLPPLSGLRSLSTLDLKECNLIEIPEDIGCLSSLEWLDLRRNMFESLPKSIKHLSKLETLSLSDCNMLRSLTELPVALKQLDAINCEQLCQALPDASEFKRCITSKYHISRWECDEHLEELCQLCPPQYVQFFFFNCFNLDQKAVSNVFKESLEGSEEPPTQFSIYLPGTEIPEWFTYQNPGSSINIQVLRQDLVNRKFMGFAICAVLGIEEFHKHPDYLAVDIYCHFETCADRSDFPPSGDFSAGRVSINSDHILLGYSSFSKFLSSSQNLEMLPDSECDYVDIQFEFNNPSEDFKVKYCAVHPIYAQSP